MMEPDVDGLTGMLPSEAMLDVVLGTIDDGPLTPFLEIIEQPKRRAMRFRYECEGRSAGSILGERSTDSFKSYPAVQIVNGIGPARLRVSLVTKSEPYHPHPHALVGKDCKDGVCELEIPRAATITQLTNLGIQCVKKKEVLASLLQRLRNGINPFGVLESELLGVDETDMNVVRLCFEAFVRDGQIWRPLVPVVSQDIRDKKATNVSELKICRVNKNISQANGGEEIFILCDKVQKDDIEVRFFNESGWEAFGCFAQTDVHRQVAIVLRTPPYCDPAITTPATAFMQLRRPSDGEASDPLDFQFIPSDLDPHGLLVKRKRKADAFGQLLHSPYLNTFADTFKPASSEPSIQVKQTRVCKSKDVSKKNNEDQGVQRHSTVQFSTSFAVSGADSMTPIKFVSGPNIASVFIAPPAAPICKPVMVSPGSVFPQSTSNIVDLSTVTFGTGKKDITVPSPGAPGYGRVSAPEDSTESTPVSLLSQQEISSVLASIQESMHGTGLGQEVQNAPGSEVPQYFDTLPAVGLGYGIYNDDLRLDSLDLESSELSDLLRSVAEDVEMNASVDHSQPALRTDPAL
uniref:V-rel avian reticuloendotheliosis viral oncogene homolog n=1 Tax=Eptatretus burgeri TaxID=7764 RepID=A0A8C4Q3E5_EPTBU